MIKPKYPKNAKMSVLYMNPQVLEFEQSLPTPAVRHKSLTLKSQKFQQVMSKIKKINSLKLTQQKQKQKTIAKQHPIESPHDQFKQFVSHQFTSKTDRDYTQKHVNSFQLYRTVSKQRNHKRGFSDAVNSQKTIQNNYYNYSEQKAAGIQKYLNNITYQPGKKVKIYKIQNYFNPVTAIHTKPEKGSTLISSFPRKINKPNSSDKKHLNTLQQTNNKHQMLVASRKIGFQNLTDGKSRSIKTAFQLSQRIKKYRNSQTSFGEQGICISLPIWQKKQKHQKNEKRIKFQKLQKRILNIDQGNGNAYRPWSPKNPQLFIHEQVQGTLDESITNQLYSIQK